MFVQGPSQESDTIITNQQEVLRNLNELRWALMKCPVSNITIQHTARKLNKTTTQYKQH